MYAVPRQSQTCRCDLGFYPGQHHTEDSKGWASACGATSISDPHSTTPGAASRVVVTDIA
jgi:hypothetical protein